MKKLAKINNKKIDLLLNRIRKSGPTKDIFDQDNYQFEYRSNAQIINLIERFLVEEQFNPNRIFEPELTEGNMSESPQWLGSYRRMNSPGIITLYERNIFNFTWYIIGELLKLDHEISVEVFDQIAHNVTYKTIYHELFHHYTDFTRIYTDGRSKYDFQVEEALAVAFSRIYLGIENNNLPLYTDLFTIAYNYQSKGYRDWKDFQSEKSFFKKLIEYSDYPYVLGTTENQNLYKICQANLEAIINNPNVEIELG
jgi:hypothetical protein